MAEGGGFSSSHLLPRNGQGQVWIRRIDQWKLFKVNFIKNYRMGSNKSFYIFPAQHLSGRCKRPEYPANRRNSAVASKHRIRKGFYDSWNICPELLNQQGILSAGIPHPSAWTFPGESPGDEPVLQGSQLQEGGAGADNGNFVIKMSSKNK
jgi:hypothetical protein